MLIEGLVNGFIWWTSIGISDAIELYTNPYIHQIHNCPDIIRKPWSQYGYLDAAKSGMMCSWFFIPFFLILKNSLSFTLLLSLLNIMIPIIVEIPFIKKQYGHDPFLGHKLLYFTNFIAILGKMVHGMIIYFR